MARKSMIIIGAGIAGLSAGCYARMNGYRAQIFEMHNNPGGLCTSWKRKGYTFDGCIHWLVGSGPGSSMHRMWEELGAVQDRQMVNHDEFVRIQATDGKTFIVYTDVDRLERHMNELAPADAEAVREMCNAIRTLAEVDMPLDMPDEPPADPQMALKLSAFIETMGKYSAIAIHDFAARFSDPFLRWAFPLTFDMPDFPMSACLMTLAWMHKQDAGYPIGGSLEFSRAIKRRYIGLGGEIHYKSRVEKVIVEDDCAVGVHLADGTEHRADIVISAADGHTTIFGMLEGKYIDDEIKGHYESLPVFPPLIQVSLGVARDFSNEPHTLLNALEEPITIAAEVHDVMGLKHYCYDPTLAPSGKSVLVSMLNSNYDYWKQLYGNREAYKAEKEKVAKIVVDQLEKRFPGITDQIEVVDVATPMTYERFTGNWRGAFEGWLLTTKTIGMMVTQGMKKTLPGLEGFYMAGQWVHPGGGLPTAARSGREIVKRICQEDKRSFVTSTP